MYIWNHQPAVPLTPEQERSVGASIASIERIIAAKRLAAAYETIRTARNSTVEMVHG